MSFANLKKNRSSSLDKLSSQLDKMASKGFADPLKEKYWTPTRDTAGNGFAIIRFLPAAEGDDVPFVRVWDHAFKSTGGWYIEKSLSTIGQDDPLGKFNAKLWNTGNEADKEQVRKQKRRLKYHSNILVVKDSAEPENEGKVFLYAYGKKIFDKLNDMMKPQFEDETPINPFDFWEGANFKLKIRQYEGYPNYDRSEWEEASQLYDGDEVKLEETYKQLNSLAELIAPSQFKTYDDLQARLHKVLGVSGNLGESNNSTAENMVDEDLDMSKLSNVSEEPEKKSSTSDTSPSADTDDDLAFFRNLADN
jgi:hypothetical protein